MTTAMVAEGQQGQVVSATDPSVGCTTKESMKKQFAYEAHTVCDRHGMVLGVKGNGGKCP